MLKNEGRLSGDQLVSRVRKALHNSELAALVGRGENIGSLWANFRADQRVASKAAMNHERGSTS
jgi:hypothetical protein